MPITLLHLEPSPNNQDVFKIETIVHTRFKVEESRRRKEVVQSYRCQAYGHTKGYCHRTPRSVKCGEQQLTFISSNLNPLRGAASTGHELSSDHSPVL